MTTSILLLCQQYLEIFPQEAAELKALLNQLSTKGGEGIVSPEHFDTGHLTAAAIVVGLPSRRVLLIEHAVYSKLLQPGGHVEATDATPLAAAYRECEEEVGIPDSAITYVPLSKQNKLLPFNMAVYDIPPRPDRGHPAHHHFDFLYLFTVPDDVVVKLESKEASNHHWISFEDFTKLSEFSRQAGKVKKLLSSL